MVSHAACERSFYVFKYIKWTKERTFTSGHLEVFTLMATEKYIFVSPSNDLDSGGVEESNREEILIY